jgi:hypothetical protein
LLKVRTVEVPGFGTVTTKEDVDGRVSSASIRRLDGSDLWMGFPWPVSHSEAVAHVTKLARDSSEPSLKDLLVAPFPLWPPIPDLGDRVHAILRACQEAGLVSRDSPGVRQLLDLVVEPPENPDLVLQRAEGMLAETGRHIHKNGRAYLYQPVDGEHAFWLALVAALLHRRCRGYWPSLPSLNPIGDHHNAILDIRYAAKYVLATAGVIPYPNGGDPAP